MLQPRRNCILILVLLVLVDSLTGQGYNINQSPRRRRQDEKDVTTVLLVDSNGRSSFGRYLNVKPDVGLITSTARTFIQEGVTTEYATQVLGTTLDNGRLYAHLLTKSSRVLYDDTPSKAYAHSSQKWNINDNIINVKQFVKNTDYVAPSRSDAFYVFPTKSPNPYSFIETNSQEQIYNTPQEIIEEELLKESPSNNFRVPYEESEKKVVVSPVQHNIKVFKISPQLRDMAQENIINHKEQNEPLLRNEFSPSKVKPWDNLPTFTVRNEFSPSGLSFLGDFPDFDEQTEKYKLTTPSERKAKLLFRAGLVKPNPKDLKSITYTGFADFTTTVGDTVIIFTPHTSESVQQMAEVTKISVDPTIIKPTTTLQEPPVATKIKTFLSQEPPMETKTVQGHKLDMKTMLPTMIIDKTDRHRVPKKQSIDEHVDLAAKSAVLAQEQGKDMMWTTSQASNTFTPEIIQPSESQPTMLSTPSEEDIAKIFALLQASAKQSTEPLSSSSSIINERPIEETRETQSGATTIFFDDDAPIETSLVQQFIPSVTLEQKITTTTEKESVNTKATTTEKLPETTEKIPETTENQSEETTSSELLTTSENVISTIPIQETTPEIEQKNIDEKLTDPVCIEGSQLIPTTFYKTLTYLTTFFIPDEDRTSTSIKSNEVVSTEISFQTQSCELSPTSLADTTLEPTTTPKITEQPTTIDEEENNFTPEVITEQITTEPEKIFELPETTPLEITTERKHVTESEPETTEATTEEGDEVELIFKTLYTTYTYLTTYFQDTTSSIASRIVVTTNVITSTLDPNSASTDEAMSGFLDSESNLISSYKSKTVSFDDLADISPTNPVLVAPTTSASLYDGNEDTEDMESNLSKPTPTLNDNILLQTADGVKTYYTTYTYFTTIFVDGETEISSHTEVYTNYVGTPSTADMPSDTDIRPTKLLTYDSTDIIEERKNRLQKFNIAPQNNYNTITRHKPVDITGEIDDDNEIFSTPSSKEHGYVTLQRGGKPNEENEIGQNKILDLSDYETIATMVTDVRSSTSEGIRRIIDNLDKRNVLLDDQIVSESNNDSEIIPSPTLLVQTSFTTFTYFTTMYHGTTSSNIVSRLETVTNVVTQTLTPTHTLSPEDLSLPVTSFTTFTYWTTLYKEGTTKVTSREETVSNVQTPTIEATMSSPSISQTILVSATDSAIEVSSKDFTLQTVIPSTVGEDELTTYFTTHTYYTTSYFGDSTVLNSRLETVTNVVNNSGEIDSNSVGRAIGSGGDNKLEERSKDVKEPSSDTQQSTGLLSTMTNTVENDGKTTFFSTDVYGTYIDGTYAKVLETTSSILSEVIAPSSVPIENMEPTAVSINKGKIVDAEGVSTLFYTTQAIGTYVDKLYITVTQSTSSLTVDEVKKAGLPTDLPIAHRTGLVRLIEGSIIQNDTTTFYESKVLGTLIDGRYAQIIESTSSFLVGSQSSVKPSSVVSEIVPSPTQAPDEKIAPSATISPSPVVVEGSISDSVKEEGETTEEYDEEEKEIGRPKSRLTFQSKKRTLTAAIRPFASRQRPTFAPKRKLIGQSTAATITRSDFVPTVTAVPASKSNRFGGRRSSSGVNQILPTASGSRRFSRPKSTSVGKRNFSSRIQPTATGFGGSSRRGGFRSSSPGGPVRSSSLYGLRPRIRPTLASGLIRSPSSNVITQASLEEENDLTTVITEDSVDGEDAETTLALQSTTEASSRRSQNPLLRFRRPPLPRPTPSSRTSKPGKNNAPKKAPTTTTAKPRTTFNRPSSLLNRPRPNGLLPRRGLFTTTTTTNPPEPVKEENEEEDEDSLDDTDDLEEEGDFEEDTDYDSSRTDIQIVDPPSIGRSNNFQIRPFSRNRSRRDTYSRFRRPPSSRTTTAPESSHEETESPRPTSRNRYNTKSRSAKTTPATTSAPTTRKRVSPSKPTSRSPFTLRNKDKPSSTYRKPTTRPGRTSTTLRAKSPRQRNSHQTESPVNNRRPTSSSRQHSRTTSRSRSSPRQRTHKDDQVDDNFVLPLFDGTITVTHKMPTEVTIPVVNGGITEYKNVVSAKYSTEVLDPREYSTSVNPFGKEVKVLVSEKTDINNGATLITQFILNEKPTTTVLFTPTYINRRKTSFSHVIPSTVYEVEEVVNTIQPALAAQAPLANILLSQLLLGGLQPQPNPLLGLQGFPQQVLTSATPTTEYKIRTTSYVTTVTSSTSTVIPLTFRGKEILTTILDSSVSVVTATEYITDTITVTPVAAYQPQPQFNTALLLPLLQQQLAQQQQLTSNPLHLQEPANVFNLNNVPQANTIYQDEQNYTIDENEEIEEKQETRAPPRRKSSRKGKKNKPTPAPVKPPKETSVITLYVSGRTPGEFTTVLSTVTVGEEPNRRKRDVPDIPVSPSKLLPAMSSDNGDSYDSYIMPASKEVNLESSQIIKETESLESIIGDVSKHLITNTPELFDIKPTKLSKASKKYKIKYVKASEDNKASSDDFLV